MIRLLSLGLLLALSISCAGVRRAQTGMRATINNPVEQKFAWGEVYCGEGTVCSEIQVLRVDFENRDSGNVNVTLKNRTGLQLQAQISLQIINNEGAQLDSTTFQDVGLPPSQQKVWSMPGVYQKGAKIRVILRRM
ncbi:MAG: hypothetical protein V4534_01030 [Myxococcota bacterium]